MRVKLQEEAKKHQGDSIGVYTLQPELVNGYPTWKQLSLMNSIWFDASSGKWKISLTTDLGSNKAGIQGPVAEDDWPQNISGWTISVKSGWKYGDETGTEIDARSDVVIEDYSEGKYENNFNSKSFEIHSILISF